MRILIILLISCMITITGCSVENKESSITIDNVVDYDTETFKNEALNFIKGDNSKLSKDGLEIDSLDIIKDANIEDCYFSGNSYYIHVSNSGIHYMYRFQFRDEVISSYIKYEYKR